MSTIIRSLHRDYRDVERLLRVLEHECDAFFHAERPDYQLLGELIEHLDVFLHRYLLPRQDLLFKRVSRSDVGCAKIIDDIVDSRTKASASLKVLSKALLDILNEQCVSRQTFDDVARNFIMQTRHQIELEEQRLFPIARSALSAADWADLHMKLRDETSSLRNRNLRGRLRDDFRRILRQGAEDRADRSRLAQAGSQ